MEEEGCIIIQTCDKYQFTWDGLFWSMNKYWDFEIPWTIYFCNEEIEVKLPNKRYKQIKTGVLDHSDMMRSILSQLKEHKYIFYMLEDYWPIKEMNKELFTSLFKLFKDNNWDSLKVTAHLPAHYKVENTNFYLKNKKILKYSKESDWVFSQQASFWKREIFENIIQKPQAGHEERRHKTSLGVEIAMDKKIKELYPNAEVYLFNYMWYPVGGVVWRGEMNLIGKQIEFERAVEEHVRISYP